MSRMVDQLLGHGFLPKFLVSTLLIKLLETCYCPLLVILFWRGLILDLRDRTILNGQSFIVLFFNLLIMLIIETCEVFAQLLITAEQWPWDLILYFCLVSLMVASESVTFRTFLSTVDLESSVRNLCQEALCPPWILLGRFGPNPCFQIVFDLTVMVGLLLFHVEWAVECT